LKFDDFPGVSLEGPRLKGRASWGENVEPWSRRQTKSRLPITLAEDSQTTSTDDLMTVQIDLVAL